MMNLISTISPPSLRHSPYHSSSSSSSSTLCRLIHLTRRRCSPITHASSSSAELELPLLPFPKDQVLVPSEVKKLHLYEARYLALLEESLFKKRSMFVHFVLDPIAFSGTSLEASFEAKYGCLVAIEKVDRQDIGALVFIRGICRVKLLWFVQEEPFIMGTVKQQKDNFVGSGKELRAKILELKEALHSLTRLEMKLKVPEETVLQTHIANSLDWAEKTPDIGYGEEYFPSLAERISFAALQPVSGSSQSELSKLQRERLKAMDTKDTLERLQNSIEFSKENISTVAAKLALQSVKVQ